MNGPLGFPAIAGRGSGAGAAKLAAGLDTCARSRTSTFGATRREEVWRDGKVVLYRFVGEHAPTAKQPLLIAYALVNRPYMVDLQADRSLVKGLLARGQDVYVLDWGYPDRSDRFLMLEDYIQRFIGGAVDYLRGRFGLDAINLLGICQGGAFSLCYASLNPDKVRNLITMVTPVDFHTDGNMLSNWVQSLDVDLFVDTLGNVPADLMNYCYLMLKPFRLNLQKYVGLVDILDDRKALEDFLRMEKWIFDSPTRPARRSASSSSSSTRATACVRAASTSAGEDVHLGWSNAGAQHLRRAGPPGAAGGVAALKALVGTEDYTELSFRGGHIGIYVSGRAQRSAADHPRLAGQSGERHAHARAFARRPHARRRDRRHRRALRLELDRAAHRLRRAVGRLGRVPGHPRVPDPVAADAGGRR